MKLEDLSPQTWDMVFAGTLYLGIDPGVSNGVSGYDKEYQLRFTLTVPEDTMSEFLEHFKDVKLIVCEDFLLYPNKAMKQVYSDMTTSRVIGRIEEFCKKNDIKLVKQRALVKKNGYSWLGIKPPSKSNPNNHEMDAHVHFMYWAITAGKVDVRDFL